MNAWSDLPNAKHIDRVLASLKEHPEIWAEAGGTDRSAAFRNTAWVAICDSAYDAACNAAWNAARDAACNAAWDAFLALVAYDDCEQYLNLPSEQLRAWSLLTEHPAAMLLLPAVVAFERIKELETV